MDVEAAKMIGAGIAVIALMGVGVGIGNIFSTLIASIARNPAARNEVFGIGILGFALTEAVALFALLIPIEILSYLSRPVSLSVRLFANMMAGHTMMKVFGTFVVMLGVFGVAPMLVLVALTGFEILVAVLQAYVFTILTCIYLNDALHLH